MCEVYTSPSLGQGLQEAPQPLQRPRAGHIDRYQSMINDDDYDHDDHDHDNYNEDTSAALNKSLECSF